MQANSPFLSTLNASPNARRIALAVALASLAVFLAAAPFAKVPLPQLPAFLPIYQSALAHEAVSHAATWRVGPLPVVHGDGALLQLAFVNLLSNGIKYRRTRQQPSIEIDFHSDASKGHTVRVRDNGVGFSMAHAANLFRPFERLHSAADFEGTLMGLANVRRIMERHGGTVSAESAPDQGAIFALLFRA